MLTRRILAAVALVLAILRGHAAQGALKRMPSDARPAFEVSTVKPADPLNESKDFSFEGRIFYARNYNVEDLIALAYGFHSKQLVGAPHWFHTTLYDIDGIPDTEGIPNQKQKCAMLQKLLVDRFHLAYHVEKRELPVYVITVDKGGSRLQPSASTADDPERFRWQGRLGDLKVTNMSISDFAVWFQKNVTERPMLDRTGLTGRFDFTLTWLPGESEFPQYRATGGFTGSATYLDGEKTPPDLYKAFEEQLGLHIRATRAPVDVMVVDHAERPAANQ